MNPEFARADGTGAAVASSSSEICRRRALFAGIGLAVLSGCSALSPRPPAAVPTSRAREPFESDSGMFSDPSMADDVGPPGAISDLLAREVTFLALSLVDTPYRFGGNTPGGGFDCSGLIVYVYREVAGVALPRTVARLAGSGQPVPTAIMRTGDLVLFDTSGRFSHAGIFVGDARFVHAPSTGGTVRLDTMRTPYWRTRLSGVRRI